LALEAVTYEFEDGVGVVYGIALEEEQRQAVLIYFGALELLLDLGR
jgi:hypothetical protein